MKKLIEMVCTGNNGRSPVMRLLAKRRLHEIGKDRDYVVDTSGIYVDQIRTMNFPREQMVRTINLALPRDIFRREEKEVLGEMLKSEEGDLKPYFERALPKLMEEEREYRTKALESLGLDPTDIQPPMQTTVREGVIAYIAADKSVAEGIERIYKKIEDKPIIASASELTELPELLEIDRIFNYNLYKEIVGGLVIRMPRAVDEILRRTGRLL